MNERRLEREGALNPDRGSTRHRVTEVRNSLRSFLSAIQLLFLNHMDAWGTAVVIAVLAIRVHGGSDWKTSLLILGIGSLYWVGFAYNDFHDAPDDALDPTKGSRNFFVNRAVSTRWAGASLGVISLGLILVFGYFGWPALALLVLSLGIMWAYSAPPLRLKNRAGLDLLTHAIFIQSYPYLLVFILLGLTWSRLDTILWTILFLSSLAAQLEQQAGDSLGGRADRLKLHDDCWSENLSFFDESYFDRGRPAVLPVFS